MAARQRLPKFFLGFFLLIEAALSFADSSVFAARVVISCGSVGKELEVCRSGAEAWARKTGNEVEIFPSPSSAGERLGQLQLLLAAKSADIDVFLVDTTWPGMLADFFVDLGSDPKARAQAKEHFPSFIKNNTVGGKLIALPWFIDAGMLYYRTDLLEKYGEKPPETWTEMTRIARKIQEGERRSGSSRFWGYVFQGRAYEGLTCNGLEWVESYGGGSIVDSSGKVTIKNPNTMRALSLVSTWVGMIAPRGVLNYMEEESRGVFQSGNAAFLRNWPYVWKLANAPDSPIRGKVGMSVLPRGEGEGSQHVATLGGWSLAVSKSSKNIAEAISLVTYLTGVEEQKRRTLLLGQNPTIPSLYRDPELIKDNAQLPILLKTFEKATPRPSGVTGTRYNRVSAEFWESLHRILSGESKVDAALSDLEKRLVFLSRGGKW